MPSNMNRDRRTPYQHPKGAPDADVIFGSKCGSLLSLVTSSDERITEHTCSGCCWWWWFMMSLQHHEVVKW